MISVCIATHNGERYIKEQLESILAQLGSDDEVVISDDGSSDGTINEIKSLNDKRLNVINFEQPLKTKHSHEYVCRNFENALKHAKGDYIFLSDQDDIWMPNKVEVCMKDLETSDLVLHDFMHVDGNGNVIKPLHYNGNFRPKNYLMRRGKHYGCAMGFRRDVLNYVLPFPKHLLLHDFWLGILVESLGRFYFEKMPLLKYRIHQQNTSKTHNSLGFKLSYRTACLYNVIKRILVYKLRYKRK